MLVYSDLLNNSWKEGVLLPPKKVKSTMYQRKAESEKLKQQQRKRRLLWFSTVGVLLALIIIVLSLDLKPAVKAAEFDYASLPVLGSEDAPVKIVEFGDFKCPSCKIANETIKPPLTSDYIEQGDVAFYFANLPFLAEDSMTAALAVQSVYHQNAEVYWDYFDAVFANQGEEGVAWATSDFLVGLAQEINLPVDYELLRQDIENKTYQSEVNDQYNKADDLNVQGTPAFFINGIEYHGRLGDYAAFKKAVDEALEQGK